MPTEPVNNTELYADEENRAILDLSTVLSQRSDTYALLARLYRHEFDQELLDEMHQRLYPAEPGDSDLYTGYLSIATYLSNLWSGSLDELKVDYARCFLGHGVDAYSAAYPYESVYTSAKRLMMEAARDEVLAIYRAYGIQKAAGWNEGEDHLALELEFERILCDRTRAALTEGDRTKAEALLSAQYGFLKEHLVSWVPLLTADMKVFAQTKLYRGLAFLTEGFLRIDYDFFMNLFSNDGTQPAHLVQSASPAP